MRALQQATLPSLLHADVSSCLRSFSTLQPSFLFTAIQYLTGTLYSTLLRCQVGLYRTNPGCSLEAMYKPINLSSGVGALQNPVTRLVPLLRKPDTQLVVLQYKLGTKLLIIRYRTQASSVLLIFYISMGDYRSPCRRTGLILKNDQACRTLPDTISITKAISDEHTAPDHTDSTTEAECRKVPLQYQQRNHSRSCLPDPPTKFEAHRAVQPSPHIHSRLHML